MTIILLTTQIILALLLIFIILIQKTSSEGWSALATSSSGSGIFSKKSSANFLTRFTSIVAALFMINSLVLANIVSKENQNKLPIDHQISRPETKDDTKPKVKHDASSVPLAE